VKGRRHVYGVVRVEHRRHNTVNAFSPPASRPPNDHLTSMSIYARATAVRCSARVVDPPRPRRRPRRARRDKREYDAPRKSVGKTVRRIN